MVSIARGRYLAEHIPGARMTEFEGDSHVQAWGDQEPILAELQEFLTGETRAPQPAKRVLATVLFTDIVDSTLKAASAGDAEWRRLLDRHDEICHSTIAGHGGRTVKGTGDGVLATFDAPGRALQCADGLRHRLSETGIKIRAGVHTGEVELRGDDIGGIAVHIASRVESAAGAGEVLASRTVKDLTAGSDYAFESRGVHQLKGVPDDWELFAVERRA